jgi:hypothetical protein
MTDPDEVGPAIQRGLKTGHFRMLPRLLQADWHLWLDAGVGEPVGDQFDRRLLASAVEMIAVGHTSANSAGPPARSTKASPG